MKKTLLTISLFCTAAAFAQQPTVWEDEIFTAISPNGVWVAGDYMGDLMVRNLETGKIWNYKSTSDARFYYGTSLSTSLSNDGVLIGTTNADNAAYWKDGVWKALKTPYPEFISNTGGITPDGSVICGGIGFNAFGYDSDRVMLSPAVWYRQEDGSYGDPVPLPHPERDFTGRHPQYVTAVAISSDGKTVAGQIRDYTGFVQQPIVYHCDENGEWSYKMLAEELINPYGMEFPRFPGELADDLSLPSQEQFMSPEQIEEYTEAFLKWVEDYEGPEPQYEEFMTPEQIAAYQEALEAFMVIYEPWAKAYEEFMGLYYDCIFDGCSFYFNNARLSPDGKYYMSTGTMREEPMSPTNFNEREYILLIDTETGEYQRFSTRQRRSIIASSITEDYSIFFTVLPPGEDSGTRQGYVFPQMSEEAMPLLDYVYSFNPELGDWMEEYMTHEVITGLGTTSIYTTEDMVCTGTPVPTPDLSTILTYNTTFSWMDYDMGGNGMISFVLPTGLDTGVETVETEVDSLLKVLAGGVISLEGDFESMDIYDLAGNNVRKYSEPNGTVDTGLSSGIYIIRALTGSGSEIAKKVKM